MTTLMLSIFETVNTKRDQATSKPASKQAKATTSDPVTNTDLFFDNCVTLNFWVGELDRETDGTNLRVVQRWTPDQSHFIFEINDGTGRIRDRTTLDFE